MSWISRLPHNEHLCQCALAAWACHVTSLVIPFFPTWDATLLFCLSAIPCIPSNALDFDSLFLIPMSQELRYKPMFDEHLQPALHGWRSFLQLLASESLIWLRLWNHRLVPMSERPFQNCQKGKDCNRSDLVCKCSFNHENVKLDIEAIAK